MRFHFLCVLGAILAILGKSESQVALALEKPGVPGIFRNEQQAVGGSLIADNLKGDIDDDDLDDNDFEGEEDDTEEDEDEDSDDSEESLGEMGDEATSFDTDSERVDISALDLTAEDAAMIEGLLEKFTDNLSSIISDKLVEVAGDAPQEARAFLQGKATSELLFLNNIKSKILEAIKGPVKQLCLTFVREFLPHAEAWVASGMKPPAVSKTAYERLLKPLALSIFNMVEQKVDTDVPDSIWDLPGRTA